MRRRNRPRCRALYASLLSRQSWKLYARMLEELLGDGYTPEHAYEVLKSRAHMGARARYRVKLYGSSGPYLLAQLVMMAIVRGPLPKGAPVHHLNGDREDDRPENLALVESDQVHVLADGRGAGVSWRREAGSPARLVFTTGPHRGKRVCRGVLCAALGVAKLPAALGVVLLDGDERNVTLENMVVVGLDVRGRYGCDVQNNGEAEAGEKLRAYAARFPECRGQGFVDWYAAQTAALGKPPERAPGGAWRGQ